MAAARPPPEIKVYAPLPLNGKLDADLFVHPTNWRWVHCLTIPVAKFNALQLSRWPYKWIRYAIGVVLGAEGVLYTSPDSPNVVEDSPAPLAESADVYYHIGDEEKRRMFPVDPRIGRTGVTSYASTPRRTDFRNEVARRDGNHCVLSGYETGVCEAVHLLSHSKGDTYISSYTQHRSRPIGADTIEEIDSVRNGLFLNIFAHQFFGISLAFLMTPNFAMNTTDVDPNAPPNQKRCTSHLFKDHSGTPGLSGSFQTLKHRNFPPAMLFDAVYADVVSAHFGTPALKNGVTTAWKDTFYPVGVMTAAHAELKGLADAQDKTAGKKETQAQARDTRYDARDRRDAVDIRMAPYIMIPPNELQAMFEEAREKAEAAERKHVHEKVDAWRMQTTAV